MRTDRLILTKKIFSPLYQWSHLSKNTKRFYRPNIWGGKKKKKKKHLEKKKSARTFYIMRNNNKMKACELKNSKIEGDGRYKLNLKASCP